MKIFIAALLFAIAISQATADAAASANDKYFWPPPPPNYYELLQRVNSLEQQLAALTSRLNTYANNEETRVRQYIKNGIQIGNRWRISLESGSYLVFRDLLSGGDKRYAMSAGVYRDL